MTKNGERLRVGAYIRVSDESQVEGYSLDAQEIEIRQWCERQGHDLVRVYREAGVSARHEKIEKRPQPVALLNDVQRREINLAAVHTVDRWSRKLMVQMQAFQRLAQAGAGFVSVTQPDLDFRNITGKAMLNLMGVLAEYVSDQTGEHVRKSQRQRARLGLPVGPIPFGYRSETPGGVPVPVPKEAEGLQEAFRRRAAGDACSHAAEHLNGLGLRTREGHRFTSHAMKDIFNNRFYVGIIAYNGEEQKGQHEPIIDEALFDSVQARRHRRTFRRAVYSDHGAAQGRVSYVRCGNPIQSDRSRKGKPMYRERHARECSTSGRSIVASAIDEQIGFVFGSLQIQQDWREKIARLAAASDGKVVDAGKLLAKRKRVVRAYLDENIDENEYRRRLSELDAQLQAAQPADLPSVEEASALLADLPALWAEATGEERQRLISSMIERVYVDIEFHCIAAITPTPAFRSLLKAAVDQDAQSTCILVEGTKEVDWAEWWTWWRRGRVELPVQRRARLRSYRCVRR